MQESFPNNREGRLVNRLEKYRLRRSLRQKYLSAAFVFFFLMIAGLLSADYSTNALISGNQGIKIFSLENKQTYLEIDLMNQKFYINIQYINRDVGRLKQELSKFFGK